MSTQIGWRYRRKSWDENVWRTIYGPRPDDFETPRDWVIEPLFGEPSQPTATPRVSVLDDELLIEWIGHPNHHVTISVDTEGAGYAIRKDGNFEPGVAEIGTKAAADEINAAIAAIPCSTARTDESLANYCLHCDEVVTTSPHCDRCGDPTVESAAPTLYDAPPSPDTVREALAKFLAIAWKVRVSYHDGVRAAERDLTDVEISLIFAALSSAPVAGAKQWHHKKSGHVVTEIGRGRVQASTPIVEMQNVVIYEHDGNMWVRAVTEFEDGRFEPYAAPRNDRGGEVR